MICKWLRFSILSVCVFMPSMAVAETPADNREGCKTIEELCAAYKKATETKDWKSLFLLGTKDRRDCDLLLLALEAARSEDKTLRSIAEKYGADWKQFDREWTEADNQRLIRDYSTIAASLGRHVKNKPEFFTEASGYIDRANDPSSEKIREFEILARNDKATVARSIGTRTFITRCLDDKGNEIGRHAGTASVQSQLLFRRIGGCWYLATDKEIESEIEIPPLPALPPQEAPNGNAAGLTAPFMTEGEEAAPKDTGNGNIPDHAKPTPRWNKQ